MTQKIIVLWPKEKMAFFCKECGLRLVLLTKGGMSAEELKERFKEFNP